VPGTTDSWTGQAAGVNKGKVKNPLCVLPGGGTGWRATLEGQERPRQLPRALAHPQLPRRRLASLASLARPSPNNQRPFFFSSSTPNLTLRKTCRRQPPPTMATEPNDLAFNPRLYAYRIASPEKRQEKLVIRIKHAPGVSRASNMAAKTLARLADDQSGAGETFSDRETNTEGAYLNELVLVVGEIIPSDTPGLEGHAELPTPCSGRSGDGRAADFDRERHHIFERVKSHLVVRELVGGDGGKRNPLFALLEKKDGICDTAQLPSTITRECKNIFYYPEWVDTGNRTATRDRESAWKANMAAFCRQYIEAYNVLDMVKASSGQAVVQAPLPTRGVAGEVIAAMAAFHATRNRSHLLQAKRFLTDTKRSGAKGRQDKVDVGRALVDKLFTRPSEVDEDVARAMATELEVRLPPCPRDHRANQTDRRVE